MIWPPVKAWTSKIAIGGHNYFIAINYGGKQQNKWILFMSVLDSRIVVKVNCSQLTFQDNWECGWIENIHSISSKSINYKFEDETSIYFYPSSDSGLTVPINTDKIRPWFVRI
tara:strand:+ start:297 stop:635 length:339 start_codon:yes stop_codon:yes gene_type:complete